MQMINGDIKTAARKEITKNIKKVVLKSLGFFADVNSFRMNMTIQQVIDNHYTNNARLYPNYEYENERFKTYICAIDSIIEGINAYYPFIDITGIDMGWTIKQIIDIVAKVYFSLPAKTIDDLKKEGTIK
jgi:hypothetical protein